MITYELAPPCDPEAMNYMMQTLDHILACATNELGPAETVKMLRAKADALEAISTRRMH